MANEDDKRPTQQQQPQRPVEDAPRSKKEEERDRDDPIDPVTNQRASDFLPTSEDVDPRSVELIMSNRRASGVEARAAALSGVKQAREQAEANAEQREADRKLVEETNKLPESESVMIDPATYRARAFARVQAEARTLGTSTTVPGGRYEVNGVMVNAYGERVTDDEAPARK